MKVLVAQSGSTLCDPMDCSPPGSSVHGILQARILEWVAMPFSPGFLHCRLTLYYLRQQRESHLPYMVFIMLSSLYAHYLERIPPPQKKMPTLWRGFMFFVFLICYLGWSQLFFQGATLLISWLHEIMVYDPFNIFLDSVCQYFVEDFCIYIHQ